ncbi:hypothetical protein [Cellulomonas cellasea]|uniref:Lipoprotein n=1 Tax=Cellulomonas cellasea TaxID=43670 RepID=A0A7W4YE21_9CELL|nr:hypothetical protein [Cellulomonas cellasea]MBB2925252.1 hypothetical protein [Cellulomonas cellasea]
MTGIRQARRPRPARRARWHAAVVLAAVLLVAGCTGDDTPAPVDGDAETSDGGGRDWTATELIEAVSAQEDDEVLRSVEGELAHQTAPTPARFEVVDISADDQATVLVLRLTYLGDGDVQVPGTYLSPDVRLVDDVRGLALQVPTENIRYQPTLAALNTDPGGTVECLCSDLSEQVDAAAPFLFTASFPALDPATRTVDLELAGFPLIEDLPVDRE